MKALLELLEPGYLPKVRSRTAPSRPVRFSGLMALLGVLGALFYFLHYFPGNRAGAFVLMGWVITIRLDVHTGGVHALSRHRLALIALRSLDAAAVLAVGLLSHLRAGYPESVMIWAVAAAITGYLNFYSGMALLKAVPAKVRLAEPEVMVAVDHQFLSGRPLWGAERELIIGFTALGLFLDLPEWGLGSAVVAGNLNWILRSWNFWRQAGRP